ncbi:MAG: GvpL/GvpF family gas vesicle protein [Bacteroidales bacterium]|nr:GvpL/GvpF family gas vesicle protein [Bacteroidales bacterium]
MEGLYLYCVRDKTEGNTLFSIKGVDGKRNVFTLPFRELEAVVSGVSVEEFDSETIQNKAQEDLNWIKEKAVMHESVVEEAMRKENEYLGLIPMHFGTIFKEEASLKDTLNKDYEKIKLVLDNIRGKKEYSLKVYLSDKKILEQTIKEANEVIKDKEREIASSPEGMAFFMEEDLKEIIEREMNTELNNIMDSLFETFKKHSVDSVRNKVLGKDLTRLDIPMVLNAAYLITGEKIEAFKNETERLKQEIQKKGFSLEYSGPWPVYNFLK